MNLENIEFDIPFTSNGKGGILTSDIPFDGTYIHDDYDPILEEVTVDPNNFFGWEVASTGFSSQDCYSGPVMHPSETLSGNLAQKILDEAGTYVLTPSFYKNEPFGWVVLKKK